MNKIKVLIVDDEVLIAEDLKDMLMSFGFKLISMAHDKNSAIELLKTTKVDIALLDIRMTKELDGLEIREFINLNTKIPFIYITAHSDVAMIKEIIKTKPIGYITKPFKKSDLFATITLAVENMKEQHNQILKLKDGYETRLINFDDIIYVESEGNYLNIYCTNNKFVSRQSLDSILTDLNDTRFLKIHRSYIINLNKVTKFSKKELQINNTTLPISRNVIDEFESRINGFNVL